MESHKEVKNCAVGRCMLDPKKYENKFVRVLDLASDNNLDDLLKPEYRNLTSYFWRRLQDFHDYTPYWESNGLTKEGLKTYNEFTKDCETDK